MKKKYEFKEDYQDWKKGDVIEHGTENYHMIIHPLLMRGILTYTKKKVNVEKKEEVNFDLNNDGVVDEKDSSIAGKVLASRRKYNKKGDK